MLGELGRILEAAGCTAADVVKLTLFLTDVADRPLDPPGPAALLRRGQAGSDARRGERPAVPGALIEIDAVAALP